MARQLRIAMIASECVPFAKTGGLADVVGALPDALKALAGRGLINYSPYRHITLTAEGRRIAQDIVRRHNTLKEFFIATLQLDPQEAEANACRIEHAIDAVAVDRLVHFLEFLRLCPRTNLEWLDGFALYCRRGAQGASCKECLKDCLEQID